MNNYYHKYIKYKKKYIDAVKNLNNNKTNNINNNNINNNIIYPLYQ